MPGSSLHAETAILLPVIMKSVGLTQERPKVFSLFFLGGQGRGGWKTGVRII